MRPFTYAEVELLNNHLKFRATRLLDGNFGKCLMEIEKISTLKCKKDSPHSEEFLKQKQRALRLYGLVDEAVRLYSEIIDNSEETAYDFIERWDKIDLLEKRIKEIKEEFK